MYIDGVRSAHKKKHPVKVSVQDIYRFFHSEKCQSSTESEIRCVPDEQKLYIEVVIDSELESHHAYKKPASEKVFDIFVFEEVGKYPDADIEKKFDRERPVGRVYESRIAHDAIKEVAKHCHASEVFGKVYVSSVWNKKGDDVCERTE